MSELWRELAARASLELSDAQVGSLHRYLDLLLEVNTRMNLTRITDRAAAEVHHVGDALTLLPLVPPEPHRLADVGTGGGVPGIPLAVVRGDVEVTLIESTKKKAAFLREAAAALGLGNVQVVDTRVEDLARGEGRESFDVATARAVATMDWLAEWCLPLVRRGGVFLAMKGPKVLDELPAARKAIRACGGGEPVIQAVELPGTENRVIVRISKIARGDPKYPRPATQAKGKPLR